MLGGGDGDDILEGRRTAKVNAGLSGTIVGYQSDIIMRYPWNTSREGLS